MQIAVCDDEKACQEMLSGYIQNCINACDDNIIDFNLDTYSSGEQLLESCSHGSCYDIIFLDIKMKELNGFDTAKSLREIDNKTIIIFVTSISDYIFNSFEYRPFWYLIKPLDEQKFRHVFFKAMAEIKNINGEYSFFSREDGLVSMEINKILYLESFLRKIIVQTSKKQCSYYGTITDEESKLSKYNFIRIHKGYLVNMAHIQRINKTNVVLKNGEVLPLSEHRFKAVFDGFTSYLAR
jgi:DNA-binding LytR/AlgR family response regulator